MRDNGKEVMEIYVATKTADSTDGREDERKAFKDIWNSKYGEDSEEKTPWHKDDLKIKEKDFDRLGITGQMRYEVTKELLRTVIEDPEYNTRHELVKRAGAVAGCLSAH